MKKIKWLIPMTLLFILSSCDALVDYLSDDSELIVITPTVKPYSPEPIYPSSIDLVSVDESGERLIISGVVYDTKTDLPLAGAFVTVWQTDATGEYGGLRAELQTDQDGRYEFATIRPGNYQVEDITRSAHIHFTIEAIGMLPQTGEMLFADDPYLTTDPVLLEEDPDVIANRTITLSVSQEGDQIMYRGEFNVGLAAR